VTIAVYPGSFDPVTNRHIDVACRARELFDEVIISVARNGSKQALFSVEERVQLLEAAVAATPGIRVDTFEGLTVNYARTVGATALVRGLRAVSDFEYEFQIALMNRKLAPELETVFLMPNEKYTYLSSSIVRELARLRTDVSEFVPDAVMHALRARFDAPSDK
jgi:pantetheine-phosphate adenylyltransferase